MNRIISGVLLFFAAIVVGCGSGEPRQDSQNLAENDLRSQVERRVAEILSLSEEQSTSIPYVYSDGAEGVRRSPILREVAIPSGGYRPPEGMFAETNGEVVADFKPSEIPQAIAMDNEGGIVAAFESEVRYFSADGNDRRIAEGLFTVVQFNRETDQLLASGPEIKQVLSWPGGEVLHDLTERELSGYMAFSPYEEKTLWQMKDVVDLSASSKSRVFWGVWNVPIDGIYREMITDQPLAVADLGTLSSAGLAWAHRAEDFRIFPDPAPLFLLDEELDIGRQLTTTETEVDIRPAADANGRLYFIRMSRFIESPDGLLIGSTARAWTTPIDDPSQEQMLTAEPTLDLAVSANGERVALIVVREGKAVLLRTNPQALLERNIEQQVAALENLQQQMHAALESLRDAFDQMEMGETLRQMPFGPEATVAPNTALLKHMEAALRDALKTHVGFELEEGPAALASMDGLLAIADGYWPEEPATITAIAGLYGNTLAEAPESKWLLQTAGPAMSANLSEITLKGEGLYFTLHSPFLVARERLAGRIELAESARAALQSPMLPVLLVENYSPGTVEVYLSARVAEAGINVESASADELKNIVLNNPDNAIANQVVFSLSRGLNEPALAVYSGLNLARRHPTSADALVKAAQGIQLLGETELALKLYDRAEELAPQNADVLYDVAIGYFDESLLDKAEVRFARAKEHDVTGEYGPAIEENLRQLRMIRTESAEAAPAND